MGGHRLVRPPSTQCHAPPLPPSLPYVLVRRPAQHQLRAAGKGAAVEPAEGVDAGHLAPVLPDVHVVRHVLQQREQARDAHAALLAAAAAAGPPARLLVLLRLLLRRRPQLVGPAPPPVCDPSVSPHCRCRCCHCCCRPCVVPLPLGRLCCACALGYVCVSEAEVRVRARLAGCAAVDGAAGGAPASLVPWLSAALLPPNRAPPAAS